MGIFLYSCSSDKSFLHLLVCVVSVVVHQTISWNTESLDREEAGLGLNGAINDRTRSDLRVCVERVVCLGISSNPKGNHFSIAVV